MIVRRLVVAFALLSLSGCASAPISPERQDFAIVEGKLDPLGDCGTIAREGGGYFYVCDMPLAVERVVVGQWRDPSVTARYFMGESDAPDDVYTGPHLRRDRRGAAILWRRDDALAAMS